ncbi:phosphoribosyltransferase family protein [Lacinutrix sp.]|uniref:phosphoribosyltransferase family protein n=1 Tax=Lacinutrix sp. TaxID=1937692 RepID=UPI0025C4B827|nr:phosphoribosyltransferase family protein [Lacinutrix sp.]
MTSLKNRILSHDEITHKIRRIAYQIYESNSNETEVILAGIDSNGYLLAKKLKSVLSKISPIQPILCKVTIDKKNPLDTITTSIKKEDYKNKSVILIDDVLNSGTTLIYGVKHFLDVPLKKFKTAVLVNRNHKKYPVKADFKGISLSTSLNEHVEVVLEAKNFEINLK